MMKAMHRQGCVDFTLTQQVEQLLRDAALQNYTAAFTPGSNVETPDYSSGFTQGFILKFQDYTNGFTPDQTCSTIPQHVNQQDQNCRELKREKQKSFVTSDSSTKTDGQDCSGEVTPALTGTLKENADSPVPASPIQEHDSVQPLTSPDVTALKESSITNTAQAR